MIAFRLSKMGHNSTEAIQALCRSRKKAYADRSYYLGDPDFVKFR
jgi:gamma-glutamyltranspeptidase/glutathione hydrolase